MPKAPGPYAPPSPRGAINGYEELGPDGRTYFKVLPEVRGLVFVWVEGLKLVNDLRAMRGRHPAAGPKAGLLAKALEDLERQVRAGEIVVAGATDDAVKDRIAATQVRPDASRSMIGAIESRPIRPGGSPLPLFAIGQVDIAMLNKATLRRGTRKPYWRAQEYGYTGNIGRRVQGFFQPGNVRADPQQFRVHPIFERQGGAPQMRINRPIEERAFLRSGVMQGALLRARLWGTMEKDALAEIRRAMIFRGPPIRRP